jgi:DNA-binding NarL/FixJ family response regulator
LRDGLRLILAKVAVEVVGECANGRDALEAAERLHPDVVLMDLSMPELNGIDATRRLTAALPCVKVIGLSMSHDRRYVMAAFAAGAAGYLLKTAPAEELTHALAEVIRGNKYVSPSIAELVVANALDRPCGSNSHRKHTPSGFAAPRSLTTREREVLQLLAEGKSTKEMASRLAVGVATVETHRRQLMDKLGLRTIAELTKYAIREGLTTVD